MKFYKICILAASLNLFFTSPACINVNAAPVSAAAAVSNTSSFESVTPLKNDIRWRYKLFGNVMYKRQYDYTNKKWIDIWVKA